MHMNMLNSTSISGICEEKSQLKHLKKEKAEGTHVGHKAGNEVWRRSIILGVSLHVENWPIEEDTRHSR